MSSPAVTLQDVCILYAMIRNVDLNTGDIEEIVEVCSRKLANIVQLVNKETAKEAHFLHQYTLLFNQFSDLKQRYKTAEANGLHSFSYSYGTRLFIGKQLVHAYAEIYRSQYIRMENLRKMLDEMSETLLVMSEMIATRRTDESESSDSDDLDEAFHESYPSLIPATDNSFTSSPSRDFEQAVSSSNSSRS